MNVAPHLQSSTAVAFNSFVYDLRSVTVTELTNKSIA